jgi:hypothetical protein
MPTTTNNGWTIPADTDLVKNGASAIRTLGNAIDSTLGVYTASATGLTKISTTTLSAVSSQSFNNVFTSTYDNYRIVAFLSGSDVALKFRYRVSGADDSTSNYWWGGYYQGFGGTTTINPETGGGAVNTATIAGVSSLAGGFSADVYSPKLTNYTQLCAPSADSYNRQYSIQFRATTAFDGFTIYPTSGTLTGTVSVYGYNK